jgi:transposase
MPPDLHGRGIRQVHRCLGNKQKALVALQHPILVSVWHMLSGSTDYHDIGADHFLRHDPNRERRRAIATLNKLGYAVSLNPIEPTQTAA